MWLTSPGNRKQVRLKVEWWVRLPEEGKHVVSLLCNSLELTVLSSQVFSPGFPIAKEFLFPLVLTDFLSISCFSHSGSVFPSLPGGCRCSDPSRPFPSSFKDVVWVLMFDELPPSLPLFVLLCFRLFRPPSANAVVQFASFLGLQQHHLEFTVKERSCDCAGAMVQVWCCESAPHAAHPAPHFLHYPQLLH